jgi:hypothetical protein
VDRIWQPKLIDNKGKMFMGTATASDIVSNVAYIGKPKDYISILEDGEGPDGPFELNGWTIDLYNADKLGKKQRLFGDLATKNDLIVYLVNTDQYSDVGEYDYVVFSDEKSAVAQFLKDFSIEAVIEDTDSISITY